MAILRSSSVKSSSTMAVRMPALLLLLAVVAGTCASGAHAQLVSVGVAACDGILPKNVTVTAGSTTLLVPLDLGQTLSLPISLLKGLLGPLLMTVDGVVYQLLTTTQLGSILGLLDILGLVKVTITNCPCQNSTGLAVNVVVTLLGLPLINLALCALPQLL